MCVRLRSSVLPGKSGPSEFITSSNSCDRATKTIRRRPKAKGKSVDACWLSGHSPDADAGLLGNNKAFVRDFVAGCCMLYLVIAKISAPLRPRRRAAFETCPNCIVLAWLVPITKPPPAYQWLATVGSRIAPFLFSSQSESRSGGVAEWRAGLCSAQPAIHLHICQCSTAPDTSSLGPRPLCSVLRCRARASMCLVLVCMLTVNFFCIFSVKLMRCRSGRISSRPSPRS